MAKYCEYKLQFEADEHGEYTKMKWQCSDIKSIIKTLIEYSNIRHGTNITIIFGKNRDKNLNYLNRIARELSRDCGKNFVVICESNEEAKK